jgi:tetratricopeptide (TPR) repeat protein
VTQFSTDSLTRTSGGNLGSSTKDGNFVALGPQPALAESAMALGEGNIGGPFKTNKGWHVIKVDTVKPESTRPFDAVHAFITRTLTQQRQGDFYQQQIKQARERIGVTPDSSVIKNFLSAKKTARELFQDAQQAGAPESRIEGYAKVVETYPDADIAPQAQFMVGFIYSEELKKYDDAEKAFRALLAKYPKSELVSSAQWMVDHMRTEEAPSFPGADSLAAVPSAGKGTKN